MPQVNEMHPTTVRNANGSVEVVNEVSTRYLSKQEIYEIKTAPDTTTEEYILANAASEVVAEVAPAFEVEVIPEVVAEPVVEAVAEVAVEAAPEVAPEVVEEVVEEAGDESDDSSSHRRSRRK